MGYYCYSKKIIGWQQNVAEYITQRESLWGIDTSANHPALLHWQFKYHAFKNDPQFKRSAHIHQRWAQNNQSHKARPRENFMWNTFIFPQHLTTVAFWRRLHIFFLVVVQSLSCVWLFATPWTTAHQASLSFSISWSLLKLMSFESVTPSNHLIFCHPLLIMPSIFPSIRVFSTELAPHIRWPKYASGMIRVDFL